MPVRVPKLLTGACIVTQSASARAAEIQKATDDMVTLGTGYLKITAAEGFQHVPYFDVHENIVLPKDFQEST